MIERMRVITTAALVLEPLVTGHAEAMFEVLSDPEIYRYLDDGPPPCVDYVRERYARLERRQSPDGSQLWLNWVVRVAGHAPAGYVQATLFPPDGAWIAYCLGRAHWGHGYAQAATRAVLEHLGTEYGRTHFLAMVAAGNARSIRLLERLAFRPATAEEFPEHKRSADDRLFVRHEFA